jgi:TonB family protein
MSTRAVAKAVIGIAFFALLTSLQLVKAQSASHSSTEPETSAVDVKGMRHRPTDYGDKRAPWMTDRTKFVPPDYPAETRARHIGGTGLFRAVLDVKTGSVIDVSVLKSTGSSELDASAARAIRQWRWRPERWKEIDVPVTFTMRSRARYSGSTGELADRATTYYRKGENDQAITTLNERIWQQPTSVDAYIIRGSAYQQKGDADKALADFNQAIRLDPKSARAYCDRGILEDVLLQQPNKALADYNEAIRLAPNFQRAYVNRGVHFLEQHNYERALPDFTRAIGLIPNEPGTHGYRAFAYAKLGQRTRAQADAAAATRLKPAEMPLVRVNDLLVRGDGYRILGQQELALRDFREAVHVMPNGWEANGTLAWFLATCPEDHFRNGAEAVSVAKKACELSHWQRSGCYDTLAAAYAEGGDFGQAVKYEKQALNDSSLAPREREEREKRLALFQQQKPFRDEF